MRQSRNLIVRKMEPADIVYCKQMFEISSALYSGSIKTSEDELFAEALKDKGNARIYVADAEGQLVGIVVYEMDLENPEVSFFRYIYIKSFFRLMRVSKHLIFRAESDLSLDGVTTIKRTTDWMVRAGGTKPEYLRRLGFKVIKKSDHPTYIKTIP